MVQRTPAARLADGRRRRQLAHSDLVSRLAVLAEFDPSQLFDSSQLEDDGAANVVDFFCNPLRRPTGPPLRVLSDIPRLDALTSVLQRDGAAGLTEIRATTAPHARTPLQRMLDVFTRQETRAADELDEDEILAALKVWRWATESAARARRTGDVRIPFDRDALEGRLANLDVTRAVRKLAAHECIGRAEQMARLRRYIDEPSRTTGLFGDPAMVVYGSGGVGKSTLIAHSIIELVEGGADASDGGEAHHGFSGAWTYLDMHRPTLRDHDREAIIDEIVRQVAAQCPQERRFLEGTQRAAALRSRGAGLETVDTPAWIQAIDGLARSWANLGRDKLVVVLDTFEEVALAQPARLDEIFDLFNLLSARIVGLKLIVSGRAPTAPFPRRDDRSLHVAAFTGDAAVELLRHFLTAEAADGRGTVAVDAPLAHEIVETLGGKPLTLQLAARVLAKQGRRGFDVAIGHAASDRLNQKLIQGFLYRGILERVEASDADATEDLRMVAKAALVLRRVTPQLLADVVLPVVNSRSGRGATWFYRELAREVAFVEQEVDHLLLREELRGPALVAVGDKNRSLVNRVHRAAADYY